MKIAKRLISIIMVAAIVIGTAACFGTGAAAVDNILGDANSDGAVNSFDALVVIRHCTGEIVLTGAQKKAADVDADGAINSLDALYILHFSIGKIKKLPAADEISSDRVHLIGNYWYDPATGQVTDDNGEGFLGFSYDAHEGIFYASNNAWQRTFGYTYIYDYAAPFIVCNFDTSRVFFNYDDKEWMVQLWKGQYGYVLIGCEVGLYYRDFGDDALVDEKGRKFYKCADDEMLVKMSLGFYRDGHLVFNRSEQYSWWLTGFKPGYLPSFGTAPEDTASLMVDTRLRFADPLMMDAFIEGLKKTTDIEHNVTKKIRKVKYEYGKNYSVNRSENTVSFQWQ